MRLYQDLIDDRERVQRQYQELMFGILAEEGTHTVFDTPVQISVTWPQGTPPGFATPHAVRQWAREQLAEMRSEDG